MKRFTLLVFGLLALVAFAQEPMVAFRTLKGSSMICVTNYGPYIVAALADVATQFGAVPTFVQSTNIADNAVAVAKPKRLYEDPGTNYVAVTGSNLVLYASSGTEYFKLTFTGVYNQMLVGQPWVSPYTVSSAGNTSNNWTISINKLPGYASYSFVRSLQGDDSWRNSVYPSDFPLTLTSTDGGYGSILIERVAATIAKTFASTADLDVAISNLAVSVTSDPEIVVPITSTNDYTVAAGQKACIFYYTGAGPLRFTLPTVVVGRRYGIVNATTNTIEVWPAGAGVKIDACGVGAPLWNSGRDYINKEPFSSVSLLAVSSTWWFIPVQGRGEWTQTEL